MQYGPRVRKRNSLRPGVKHKLGVIDRGRIMFGLFKRRQKNVKKQIRPITLQDFIGQEKTKLILGVAMKGAKERRANLEHVIIYGPPGLGKTTLANIIATEMRGKLYTSIGISIQKSTDVIDLFEDVLEGDIVFIDEIHRIPIKLEELLYTAMEDGYIDLGDERIYIPKFTLVGATTRLGDLSKPLRDRFGIQLRLGYYSQEELVSIAYRTASVLNVAITSDGALTLASRSRGTPRILNNFIKRAADMMHATGKDTIDETVALATLEMLEIDELGLNRMDRKILDVMINDYNCKPVGLNTLAVSVGECAKTIQEVYEPYLIANKLIQPTSRGRVATQRAIDYMRRV